MSTPNIKTNTTELQNILEEINNLPDAGGVELPTLSTPGTANDLLKDKELIDQDGNIVVGTIESRGSSDLSRQGAVVTVPSGHYEEDATLTIPDAELFSFDISIDSNGLIKAEHLVNMSGMATDQSATKQLDTQPATTITPTKSTQTAVTSGKYTTGNITVNPIPDEYITTDDATATEETVGLGETFYADGEKKTGSFTLDTEITSQEDLISQIQTALEGKASGGGDSNGGNSANNMVTILNSTNANIIIGGYQLLHGESINIPYNISTSQFIVFNTTLPKDTIINSNHSIMPTRISEASILLDSSGSTSSVIRIGCIIPSGVSAGSTIEIITQ